MTKIDYNELLLTMRSLLLLYLLLLSVCQQGYAQNLRTKYIIIDTLVDSRTFKNQYDLKEFTIIGASDFIFSDLDKVKLSDNKYKLEYKNCEIELIFNSHGVCAEVKSTTLDSVELRLFFDNVGSSISIKNINLYPDTLRIAKWRIIDINLPKITTNFIEYREYYNNQDTGCVYYVEEINDTSENAEKKIITHLKIVLNGNKMKIPLRVIASGEHSIQTYHGYPNKRHQKRRYYDIFPYKRFWGCSTSIQYKYQGELNLAHQ
jgi:hypothetical protein